MRVRPLVLAAACALLAALATAGPATAFPCNVTLTDSAGFTWTLDEYGEATDGGKAGEAGDPYGGATDGYPALIATAAGDDPVSHGSSYVVGTNACTVGQAGKELLYPEQSFGTNAPGLAGSRRVYVPDTGRAFARWVDTLRNTSNTTRSYDILTFGTLGSDCGTEIGTTSSGDDKLTRGDRWVTTFDDQAGDDSCADVLFSPNPDASTGLPLAHNLDGPSTPPDRVDAFPAFVSFTLEPSGFIVAQYRDVTLAPGQTISYAHFESQSTTVANNTLSAKNAAIGIDGEPSELWNGMSSVERSLVRNWCIGDCDKDGVPDVGDNCKGLANSGQLNADGDAQGDACDADDDNDGRSDAVELSLGTNPRSAKDAAPRIGKFRAPKTAKVHKQVTMTVAASDDYGVRRVTFFAGKRRLCVDTTAPFRCVKRFGSKGRRTLAAVASDAIGQVDSRTRPLKVKP